MVHQPLDPFKPPMRVLRTLFLQDLCNLFPFVTCIPVACVAAGRVKIPGIPAVLSVCLSVCDAG